MIGAGQSRCVGGMPKCYSQSTIGQIGGRVAGEGQIGIGLTGSGDAEGQTGVAHGALIVEMGDIEVGGCQPPHRGVIAGMKAFDGAPDICRRATIIDEEGIESGPAGKEIAACTAIENVVTVHPRDREGIIAAAAGWMNTLAMPAAIARLSRVMLMYSSCRPGTGPSYSAPAALLLAFWVTSVSMKLGPASLMSRVKLLLPVVNSVVVQGKAADQRSPGAIGPPITISEAAAPVLPPTVVLPSGAYRVMVWPANELGSILVKYG